MTVTRQAVILAGGLGTRLGPLTQVTPKPLLRVAGAPFLEHLIGHLRRFNFDEVVLLVGYLAEQFTALTEPGRFEGVSVVLSVEPSSLLGTGGALAHAAPVLQDCFVLLNGDTLFDFNLLDLTAGFVDSPALARVALRAHPSGGRYGGVKLDGTSIVEFGSESGLINGGVYVVKRDLLPLLAAGQVSLEREVFPLLAQQGLLEGRVYRGAFLDIGLQDDLARADTFIPSVQKRPAAFMDRDGVLNLDRGYVYRADQLVWSDGAMEAVKRLNDAGYFVFVVTNQAGVARGFYGCEHVDAFHLLMNDQLRIAGAHVDAFEYCPFHPDGVVAQFTSVSRRRKPQPGMIEDLLEKWPVILEKSFLIGDQESDLAAASAVSIDGFRFSGGSLSTFVDRILATR